MTVRGIINRIARVCLNLAMVAGAAALVWYGSIALSPSASEPEQQTASTTRATPVRVLPIAIRDEVLVERRFLGRVEAKQVADIGFEFDGVIEAVAVQEGDTIAQGQEIARLKTDRVELERAALEASLKSANDQLVLVQANVKKLTTLVRRGAAPSNRLDQAKSELSTVSSKVTEVENALRQVELRLQKSALKAPFDGIVGTRYGDLGETNAAGQPIVTVFETGGALFRVGLPTSLDPRALRAPRIDVNGEVFPVQVSAVRPDIDLLTNTRTVIFEVDASDLTSFGQSATLYAEVAMPAQGAWIPVNAMRSSAEGFWTILTVDASLVAQRVAVEILHLRTDEAFVAGAFEDGAQFISAGAHKVVAGQTVRVE